MGQNPGGDFGLWLQVIRQVRAVRSETLAAQVAGCGRPVTESANNRRTSYHVGGLNLDNQRSAWAAVCFPPSRLEICAGRGSDQGGDEDWISRDSAGTGRMRTAGQRGLCSRSERTDRGMEMPERQAVHRAYQSALYLDSGRRFDRELPRRIRPAHKRSARLHTATEPSGHGYTTAGWELVNSTSSAPADWGAQAPVVCTFF